MGKVRRVLLAMILIVGFGENFAYAMEECTAVYVDVKQRAAYKARGAYNDSPFAALGIARMLCEKSAHDPRDCQAAAMAYDGRGLEVFSVCFGDEYIAVACASRDDRLYCQKGCGDSQEMADLAALAGCKRNVSYRGCKPQDIR